MLKVSVTSIPAANASFMAVAVTRGMNCACFRPRTAAGESLPSVQLEARSPLDQKPKNGAEHLGEKAVSHLKVEGDVTYSPTAHDAQSYVWRNAQGKFVKPTTRVYDFSSEMAQLTTNSYFHRDGEDIVVYDFSFTVSMVTNYMNMSSVTVTRHSPTSWTPTSVSGAYFAIDTSIQSETISYVSGSRVTNEKVSFLPSLVGDIDACVEWLSKFGPIQRKTPLPTKGRATAYYITFASSGSSPSAIASQAMRTLNSLAQAHTRLGKIPEMKDYGTLAGEAAASADSNAANMIAFIRDLKDVRSLVPKLKNLMSLKTHANNYLAYNYGIMPTIGDLESIVSSLSKTHWSDSWGNQILTAGQTARDTSGSVDVEVIRRAKLIVSNTDDNFSQMVRKLRSSGFYPSPQNLWDLVPYSFVLDWFIDIGGFLERFDSGQRLGQLPILGCTTSAKVVYDYHKLLPEALPGFRGTLTVTNYSRNVSAKPPRVPLMFDSEITAQNHLIEGSALILTRTK